MSMRYQGGFLTASYNGLKTPDAPTIGTAVASTSSASVTFTAPSNVGGGAITSYTVTSAPGGITATGVASPITVSGLTNGTAYTFTVVATNIYGTSIASAASNSVTPVNAVSSIELLIVAGGGGGGSLVNGGRGAGGGAGGLLYYGAETPKTPNGSAVSVSAGVTYSITVGAAGAICSAVPPNGDGGVSSFIGTGVSFTANGGGGGAYADGVFGHAGGSAGGGWYTGGGGTGIAGQGQNGGDGQISNRYGGGGGGGAGVAGGNGTTTAGGSGGNGLAYVISGSSTYYAGGGSGDVWAGTGGSSSPGTAGLGGGGTGNNFTGGTNGGTNLGGGGGAGSGLGGSGVVILRYADTFPAATSTTGSPTITVTGGYRIYKFTATGSITF